MQSTETEEPVPEPQGEVNCNVPYSFSHLHSFLPISCSPRPIRRERGRALLRAHAVLGNARHLVCRHASTAPARYVLVCAVALESQSTLYHTGSTEDARASLSPRSILRDFTRTQSVTEKPSTVTDPVILLARERFILCSHIQLIMRVLTFSVWLYSTTSYARHSRSR